MTSTYCSGPAVGAFEHRAVFYEGLDELTAAVLPFVREGIARDEPVLVAMLPDRLAAVEAGLGAEATRVDFVDMGELGANPACILPEWRRFVEDADGGGSVRAVGEPLWAGRRDVEHEEVALHEALINVAFEDGPGWQLMCLYDRARLPERVLAEVRRTHPVAAPATAPAAPPAAPPEPGYAGAEYAHRRFSAPLPPPPETADRFTFGPHDLAALRPVVARLGELAGVRRDRREDLVLSVHEVATNSVQHGGGSGDLAAWCEPGAFVIEVRDSGVIDDPLVGRDLLGDFAECGRGVWIANQLCDLVQVRSGRAGTVVRLFAWL